MATQGDFDGFNIDSMEAFGRGLLDDPSITVPEKEFFAQYGVNPDGTRLRQRNVVVRRAEVEAASPSAGCASFAALQARAMRALSSARVALEGKAVAALVAAQSSASATWSAHLVDCILTGMAKAIPPADLFAAATLPAAAAGHNLTPRIFPAPRA